MIEYGSNFKLKILLHISQHRRKGVMELFNVTAFFAHLPIVYDVRFGLVKKEYKIRLPS
jgi:hypothetical protein